MPYLTNDRVKFKASATLARDAMDTMARLTDMTEVRGQSLTANQSADFTGSPSWVRQKSNPLRPS